VNTGQDPFRSLMEFLPWKTFGASFARYARRPGADAELWRAIPGHGMLLN